MNIKEKLKIALLQLQEYSSNELAIVNGEQLNIAEELKALETPDVCPKCGSTHIGFYDNESLSDMDFEGLDNDIYGMVKCTSCTHTFKAIGHVGNFTIINS